MSPGSDDDVTKLLFVKSSMQDYQRRCDLDVLGIEEPVHGEQSVYEEFKEQLRLSEDGWKFYIPRKPVVKESAETTKVRVVFDASASETDDAPSLNALLETGPALQNLLWDITIRKRFKPFALSADLRVAFLQVRIRESDVDRDVLRFHWIDEVAPSQVLVDRFTQAPFGLRRNFGPASYQTEFRR